jgi:hypothetical protein
MSRRNRDGIRKRESTSSAEWGEASVIGVFLMVTVTILLAAAVLLALDCPTILLEADNTTTPLVLKITSVISTEPDYQSILVLTNIGSEPFKNDNYRAEIYRNNLPLDCSVETLNGYNFIPTSHTGVQTLGGSGCSGYYWYPGERTKCDCSDGSIRPGDTIQVDIIEKSTETLFSRDTTTI